MIAEVCHSRIVEQFNFLEYMNEALGGWITSSYEHQF